MSERTIMSHQVSPKAPVFAALHPTFRTSSTALHPYPDSLLPSLSTSTPGRLPPVEMEFSFQPPEPPPSLAAPESRPSLAGHYAKRLTTHWIPLFRTGPLEILRSVTFTFSDNDAQSLTLLRVEPEYARFDPAAPDAGDRRDFELV